MNALLASGEVPGLYEGKELAALMAGCREAAQRDGVLVDSEDELFRRFTTKVGCNRYVTVASFLHFCFEHIPFPFLIIVRSASFIIYILSITFPSRRAISTFSAAGLIEAINICRARQPINQSINEATSYRCVRFSMDQ